MRTVFGQRNSAMLLFKATQNEVYGRLSDYGGGVYEEGKHMGNTYFGDWTGIYQCIKKARTSSG